jgi:hypothetical protein
MADLEENRTSVRHMFLACVAVFHAVDHLAHPDHARTLRQQFNEQSRAFAIVDDVAHAFKHVKSGNPANPDLTYDGVISRPAAYWDIADFDLTQWDDPHGGVTLDKDRDVDLYEVVKEAVAFLRSKLN